MQKLRFGILILFVGLISSCTLIPGVEAPDQTRQNLPEVSTQAETSDDSALPLPPALEPTETSISGINPELEVSEPEGSSEVVNTTHTYYVAEAGTPIQMPAFMHAEMGCNWMGAGGQAFDLNGQPQLDLVVLLQGTLNGNPVNLFALTGSATALGPGGFEFMLSDHPIFSEGTLYITLYDSYGNILSRSVPFNTSDQCEQNLTLINFKEIVEGEYKAFLPLMNK